MAAHGSSIAALQSLLTTGLSNKADQSAFDVLEGVVATKSTPDGVDLKLSNYSTTAAMNGSIASANNATLATVAANYGLNTVVDQHSLDIAARITPLEVDTKVANALLGAVTAAALASELASRDASISGLQASKADASALTAYALQSTVDTSSEVDSKIAAALLNAVTTAALDAALLGKADASALASLLSTLDGLPLEVDTKIANALLGLATEAFVAAQLASRDAGITALQASKADTALLASYATNAALSASETALQSALDAILAELAALQLSGSGVVNAPAWAGFTTWELLRGSSVVRNLHFVAPLSAALANGDDTLSITADCYSTAGTDAAITAALLAYYTSSQVDTLLGDYRTGAAQDAETQAAITGALLAYYTVAQVDALLGDYRTASAQDTQTQAAITGALLAYRTGPDQDVFTTNQITSALVAYRSAADQDTATASSIAAALLSYYTIAQVDGLSANKLGVTEAASALQIAVRFPDDGGADEVVAAIGEQILGPTDVSLSNWTVRPSSGCSVVLATHTAGVSVAVHPDPGGEPVEHRAHLQLDARARAALRLPLPARHGLQLRGVHVRGRQRLRPVVRQLRGRPGRLEHGQDVLHRASKRSCEAALRCALPGAGPAQPNGRNGGRLRPPDPGRNPGGRQHGGGGHGLGAAAEARVPRRGGRRRHAGHPGRGAAGTHAHHARKFFGALQQPELCGLGQLRGGRLPAGGLRHDPERLRLEHRAHLHADGGETLLLRLPVLAGHGLQLGDVRQRGRQRLRGRHRRLPRHALAGRLEHGAPGLLGAAGRNREAALRSLRRLHPRAGAAVGGHAGPVQHADQGQRLRGKVCHSNGFAGGLAGPHGLGHAGLCNDVNCTDVFTTGVDASGAVSCAALTATGAVAGAALTSTGAVSGSSLSISGAASVGLLSSATGITGSTLTINNTANAGNFTTAGDVSTGTLTASGAATAASSHRGAHGRHADHHRGGLHGPAGLREPGLHLHGHERRSVDGQRGLRRRDELGHGLRAAALRLQHAHRDQHLGLLGRSLPDEELGGLEQAASVQQQRGPRQRPGAAAAGQPEREGLPGAGRRGAPVRAHHDQRRGVGADEEPLDAAVPDHEPEEPRLPRDRGQHGQRGLQHELHGLVRQPGEDGDRRGRRGRAAAAVRLRGGQAVQAPGHERGPEAGLRLGRLRRNEVEEFDGGATARRWSRSTTRTSPACCGGCARASRPGWTRWKPGRPSGGRRTSR